MILDFAQDMPSGSYMYCSCWDSDDQAESISRGFIYAGFESFVHCENFAVFPIHSDFLNLVENRKWEDFPHYDAYWFLRDLSSLSKPIPNMTNAYYLATERERFSMLVLLQRLFNKRKQIPQPAPIATEEAMSKYWESIVDLMVENGIERGVFWVDAPSGVNQSPIAVLDLNRGS
ncbi:MAG: hypothetical protein KF836_09080 [Fimbriimonadaceae bacterium]|nr:hypothetical protein [Fimbriimonadaceae bacterium]